MILILWFWKSFTLHQKNLEILPSLFMTFSNAQLQSSKCILMFMIFFILLKFYDIQCNKEPHNMLKALKQHFCFNLPTGFFKKVYWAPMQLIWYYVQFKASRKPYLMQKWFYNRTKKYEKTFSFSIVLLFH